VSELRILPLISSATEIVHALGLGPFQVGRSHECDYPAEVANLPVCTRPAIAVSGSSAEIDALVKERLRQAIALQKPPKLRKPWRPPPKIPKLPAFHKPFCQSTPPVSPVLWGGGAMRGRATSWSRQTRKISS